MASKKISNILITLSSAAILAVYSAGFERTAPAAARFAAQTEQRLTTMPLPGQPVGSGFAGMNMGGPGSYQPPVAPPKEVSSLAPPSVSSAPAVAPPIETPAPAETPAPVSEPVAAVSAPVSEPTPAPVEAPAEAPVLSAALIPESAPTSDISSSPEPSPAAEPAPAAEVPAPAPETPSPAASPAPASEPAAPAAPAAAKRPEPAPKAVKAPKPPKEPKPAKNANKTAPPQPANVPASQPAPEPAPEPAAQQAPQAPALRDGTYYGWGTSRHGDIQAEVVIQSGRIVATRISDCETRYPCSVIEHAPGQVVQRQSPAVDLVAGATQSVYAFYYAVLEALSKAR